MNSFSGKFIVHKKKALTTEDGTVIYNKTYFPVDHLGIPLSSNQFQRTENGSIIVNGKTYTRKEILENLLEENF